MSQRTPSLGSDTSYPRVIAWYSAPSTHDKVERVQAKIARKYGVELDVVACHTEKRFREALREPATLLTISCHGGGSDVRGGPALSPGTGAASLESLLDGAILDCDALLVAACLQDEQCVDLWTKALNPGALLATNPNEVEIVAGLNFAMEAAARAIISREVPDIAAVREDVAEWCPSLRDDRWDVNSDNYDRRRAAWKIERTA